MRSGTGRPVIRAISRCFDERIIYRVMIYTSVPRLRPVTVPAAFLRIRGGVGNRPFAPVEVEGLTGKSGVPNYVVLSRLAARGWLLRLGRGRYAIADPIVRLDPHVEGALAPFRHQCFYPILERAVGEVLRIYSGSVIAVALFGSAARGEAGPESDIDLLVVLDHRFGSLLDDARTRARVAHSSTELRLEEWERTRHFHQIQVVVAERSDLDHPGPLFLDLPEEARILWDPSGILRRSLRRFASRLRLAGARHRRSRHLGSDWDLGTTFTETPA